MLVCPGVASARSVHDAIGRVVGVERRVARAPVGAGDGRGPDDRRAGRLRERARERAVVAVVVRDDDRPHRPRGDRDQQRAQMLGRLRARINHREVARADEVRLRAGVRVG